MKNFKILFVLITVFLMSCAPIKRHNRLVKKYPFVHSKEVMYIHDTITISTIRKDTAFFHRFDTILIEKDRLRVRLVRVRDSIYFQGACLDTTIIRRHTYNQYKSSKPYVNYLGYITIILIVLLALLIFRALLKK